MASKPKSAKSQSVSKAKHKKPAPSRARLAIKPKTKAAVKTAKPAKPVKRKGTTAAVAKKVSPVTHIEETPKLLRETKGTTIALGLLEKSIKLIFSKDFKKARAELKSLIESHPAEPEILARARIYIQICSREEASHKKPVIGNDQLYTLGVLEHNHGNYENAISYFRQSLEKNSKAEHVYYSLAASYALKGEIREALLNLQKAVELNEENRIFAKNDVDFTPLHGRREFSELIGWNQPAGGGQS
jgi:tetratricopeptide (TPR) repeat protein